MVMQVRQAVFSHRSERQAQALALDEMERRRCAGRRPAALASGDKPCSLAQRVRLA
jgi:hypothetical protein